MSERKNLLISFTDDEKERLAEKIVKNLKESRDHFSNWRGEARESYDFFAGEQWDNDDVEKLEEEGRPAVVFNKVCRTINAVAGLELQNRQGVSYYPRGNEDSGVNDLLTGAAQWVRDNCDAEDEESESFQIVTGKQH